MASSPADYSRVSMESPKVARMAQRTISEEGGAPRLVETSVDQKVVYNAREPAVLARFPDGYLASTGVLGPHVTASQLPAEQVRKRSAEATGIGGREFRPGPRRLVERGRGRSAFPGLFRPPGWRGGAAKTKSRARAGGAALPRNTTTLPPSRRAASRLTT